MKRKAKGIIYESHPNIIAPDDQYFIDQHGCVRRRGKGRKSTKAQRAELVRRG
jgi:hypothetical protein